MKKKSLIIAILLVLVVIISSNSVFAEDATDDITLQQDDNVADIIQADEETIPKTETVISGSNSSAIQEKINSLSDGDTLNFEAGEYKDISIYVNKSITINGNGAKLIGHDNPSYAKINGTDAAIGYATSYNGVLAILYVHKTSGVTINGLTFIAGENAGSNINTALVYVKNSPNVTFKNNVLSGACSGIYYDTSNEGTIINNKVENQTSTGIFNFASARSLIQYNNVTNAANHGIDARFNTGVDVKIFNNTVIGSKEGIYLMHSGGHVVAGNTIINSYTSAITSFSANNLNIYNNKIKQTKIGILLSGNQGYSNITIGENDYALYDLPLPPVFSYYVAEAKTDYNKYGPVVNIQTGTYSDVTKYGEYYKEVSEIKAPGKVVVDYDKILTETGTVYKVSSGNTSAQIQSIIDNMQNGDTLSFEKNAKFYNISIYTDKNIKIIGNNATLYGYESVNAKDAPSKIMNSTNDNGYGIIYYAVLYSVRNANVVISDLNIVSRYPDHGLVTSEKNPKEYKTVGIYAQRSVNITITGCHVDGASFGIMAHFQANAGGCTNAIITNNYVSNQYTYGIINFGSENSFISNNTVVNARYHGIDVRNGAGPNVIVYNNTVIGSQDGIYLLHSKGHYVYENQIINATASSITAHESGNEFIFNNTLSGSRIGIALGGEYYNVTIGANTYKLDAQQGGNRPGFCVPIVIADNYDNKLANLQGTYFNKEPVTIKANDVVTTPNAGTLTMTLSDYDGKLLANKEIIISINNENQTLKTDEKGVATLDLKLTEGEYNATIIFKGDVYNAATQVTKKITVKKESKPTTDNAKTQSTPAKTTKITAKKATFKAKKSKKYTITLKAGKKAVAKVKVTIKVGKKTYSAKTNTKGKATFNLKKLTKKGKYTAVIKFAGNSAYKATTQKVKITVKK